MSSHELMSIDDQTLANIMNKRHKSAKSMFKNPPQPKFCIKERTTDGRELFINVLSYSRIANQLSEFDPIPLYGGMQIRSYSSIKNAAHIQQQSPPLQLIFAVMASPDVLKKTSRSSDSVEQMNLVELICEFLEAMNPGIVLSKKPEVLKDRDLAGELKDVWTAVQNFRDKEKAGISDIVVYTEFGPDSSTCESIDRPMYRNESNNANAVKSENHDTNKLDQYEEPELQQQQQQSAESPNSSEKDVEIKNNEAEKDKCEEVSIPEKTVDEPDSPNIEIDKLTLGGGDKKINIKNNENHHNNESSEKNVKIQNQKNKESQHHFFPKFLSSSKEKESSCKDKDKDKEKQESNEQEPKSKTKKSLNFFRRSKSSASPTHTSSNNNLSNQKSDSNSKEH